MDLGVDVVQLGTQQLTQDAGNGASLAMLQLDIVTLDADSDSLMQAERTFAGDTVADPAP